MGIIYFISAILLICVAHIIRVLRWELFIKIYEQPDRKNLIQSMSYGYLLNYILPYKLGEIVRAWVSGRKMINGIALGFSTVIVDRYLDVVFVGLIFVLFSLLGVGGTVSSNSAVAYVEISVALLILAIITYALRGLVKKGVRIVASLFNDQIESGILSFSWALIWNFKDIFQKISKMKLVLATISMWGGYVTSYYLFSLFLNSCGDGTTGVDMFLMLFTQNGIKGSVGATTIYKNTILSTHPIYMAIYMVAPTLILLLSSFFLKNSNDSEEKENYLRLLPHMDPRERLGFLEKYFSDNNRDYVNNYLKINQGISVIRDYSAGSNATTMLCMDEENTFFRKYAFGEAGEKLYQQILWIEENRERVALPPILKLEKTDMYCYYDMPYSSNSVGLFEYAHSMPVEFAWRMIQNTLDCLERSIYKNSVCDADADTIHRYIETKVTKNIHKIKNAKRIKELQQYETVYINGVEYRNLSFYERYLSESYLQRVFRNDSYAVIHGDLTIENIICTRDENGHDDFYLIDPNTGNVHESPNLDYAKLLQSIHGGYEFLMSTKDVKVVNNRINFLFTKSAVYLELHKRLREYMEQILGLERTKSIYFHEIVHWLRLMPYKIEKDSKRSVLFYAGMLMVMNDVIKMYGQDYEDING